MTVRYYFDQHMPGPITRGLRRHRIDVLTTQDDNTELQEDERLLARATELGRVFVTEDDDLLAIANRWLAHGRPFAGLVKVRDPNSMIGRMIEDFLLIDRCYESEEMVNELLFLPF